MLLSDKSARIQNVLSVYLIIVRCERGNGRFNQEKFVQIIYYLLVLINFSISCLQNIIIVFEVLSLIEDRYRYLVPLVLLRRLSTDNF